MSPQTSSSSSKTEIGVGIASAGIGVLSSIMAGMGQTESGKQEKAAFDYNAQVDLLNMSDNMVANEQRYSQLVGKQATAYAASGVDITSGSPLLMMAATAGRGGRQAEQIRQQGTQAAALETYYGKIAAWRGKMAGIGTMLSGISKSTMGYLGATGYQPDSGNPADRGGIVVDG